MKCPYCGKTPNISVVPMTLMYSISCIVALDHWISIYADSGEEAVKKWKDHFKKPSFWQRLKGWR